MANLVGAPTAAGPAGTVATYANRPGPSALVTLSRRGFLAAAASAAVLAACGRAARHVAGQAPGSGGPGSGPTSSAPAHGSTQPANGPARFVASGLRSGGACALTFHGSGELSLTNQMLDHLRRLGAPVTIFAVGSWLEANPGLSRQILEAGHALANHTYTHPSLGQLDRTAVATEITRCRDTLVRQTGGNGGWFRPSGVDQPSALMLEEAGAAGYRTVVGYDVDPHDYQDPGADAIVARVAAGLQPGSIVSLHLGHAGTVAAIDRLAALAHARGLRPVLVRDLIGSPG